MVVDRQFDLDNAIDSLRELLAETDLVGLMDELPQTDFEKACAIMDHFLGENDATLMRIIVCTRFVGLAKYVRSKLPKERGKQFEHFIAKDTMFDLSVEDRLMALGFDEPSTLLSSTITQMHEFCGNDVYNSAVVPYWNHRIGVCIERKDWVRAWDELKRAMNGYCVNPQEQDHAILRFRPRSFIGRHPDFMGFRGYVFRLPTQKDRVALIKKLAEAMAYTCIEPFQEGQTARVHVYEKRYLRSLSLPSDSVDRTKLVPGIVEARFFMKQLSPNDAYCVDMEPAGVELLRIARYATALKLLKQERRR